MDMLPEPLLTVGEISYYILTPQYYSSHSFMYCTRLRNISYRTIGNLLQHNLVKSGQEWFWFLNEYLSIWRTFHSQNTPIKHLCMEDSK